MKKNELQPSALPVFIHISRLRVDSENQRKVYDPEGLKELAASIRENGVMQNMEARPDGVLTMGNRRFRAIHEIVIPEIEAEISAAKKAKDAERVKALDEELEAAHRVPVRVLNKEEAKGARERQLIENLQREDLTPFEECMAIVDLLNEKGQDGNPKYTPESLAKRTGLTPRRVYSRAKAAHAPAAMLKAFREGKVGVVHCELIGRIPDPKARAEAAKRVLKPQLTDGPLSKAETEALIKSDYMVSLVGAPFDPKQKNLIPEAGDCETCPHRSGNIPELKDQLTTAGGSKAGGSRGLRPDVCTNTACYRAKSHAAWKETVSKAEAEGFGVLSPEAAKREFSGQGGALSPVSPYIDLNAKPTPRHSGHYRESGLKKWGEILKGVEIRKIKAQNPVTNKVHVLANLNEVEAALEVGKEESGELTGMTGAGMTDEAAREEKKRREQEERERAKRARELNAAVLRRSADAVADTLCNSKGETVGDGILKQVFRTALDSSADACAWMASWMDLPKPAPGQAGGISSLPLSPSWIRRTEPGRSGKRF